MQRLGFGHVLQHRVVLHGHGRRSRSSIPDRASARSSRHFFSLATAVPPGPVAMNSGLMPNGSRAQNSSRVRGVPQREREHAAQPRQRVGAPVVVGGDDGLAVAVGGEHGAVTGRQFGAQFQVVVDLAVEHQHVAVGRLGRAPAQRLMAMRDVDDRQPVEPEARRRSSDQVPLSSGPRWRAHRIARPTASALVWASAAEVSSPNSPHMANQYAGGRAGPVRGAPDRPILGRLR